MLWEGEGRCVGAHRPIPRPPISRPPAVEIRVRRPCLGARIRVIVDGNDAVRREEAAMRARDVMSSPVITLRMDTPVSAAAALLVSHGFTSAPVVDAENRVVGIATESDLVRGRIRPEGWPPDERAEPLVGAVMTPSPVGMRPEDDLADVVELMLGKRLRSVPIVEDGELVGIVTRRDVLRAVARRELTSEDVWRRRAGEPDAARGEVIGS
ncbi:hypothetical protein GCM10009559_53600 [Pseudonocardia zijingensis]|uniref:CBS domain-containing protein n=2 Tax=Pseudonocardia zijingensis TaxID=153376 RepID=A0ABN1N789_9PSEU